ncbi:unnamed protein product [Caretta caretta]
MVDTNVLASASVPENPTTGELEAIVESDSHLEIEGELSYTKLLETAVAGKPHQADEAPEDSVSDDEPEEHSPMEQLCAGDIFGRICQSRGFENGSNTACKPEKDLQVEVATCRMQRTLDKFCS